MKELSLPVIISAVGCFVGGSFSWLIGSPVWIGALIGFAFPVVFFAGATLAIMGLVSIVDDYLKEQSR